MLLRDTLKSAGYRNEMYRSPFVTRTLLGPTSPSSKYTKTPMMMGRISIPRCWSGISWSVLDIVTGQVIHRLWQENWQIAAFVVQVCQRFDAVDISSMPRFCFEMLTSQLDIVVGCILLCFSQVRFWISFSSKFQICRSLDDGGEVFDIPLLFQDDYEARRYEASWMRWGLARSSLDVVTLYSYIGSFVTIWRLQCLPRTSFSVLR